MNYISKPAYASNGKCLPDCRKRLKKRNQYCILFSFFGLPRFSDRAVAADRTGVLFMNTFWLHRDQIYEQGLSLGFHVFSVGHLLWLIALALFCWLTARFYCSLDEKGRDNMRKVCGLVIVLLEYLKVIVLGLFGVHMAEFVPLHLCSAAGLGVLVYALWPRMNWLGQVFAYAFVPAALLAVIFPSTTMYPWWNFYCLHTFVIHGLILAFFVCSSACARTSGSWRSCGIWSFRSTGVLPSCWSSA